jgi:hypothetical protein
LLFFRSNCTATKLNTKRRYAYTLSHILGIK